MPDGATTFIAPNRDHAESFWASFTGDKATPIRLRFIYEGGDDRLPRNEVNRDRIRAERVHGNQLILSGPLLPF